MREVTRCILLLSFLLSNVGKIKSAVIDEAKPKVQKYRDKTNVLYAAREGKLPLPCNLITTEEVTYSWYVDGRSAYLVKADPSMRPADSLPNDTRKWFSTFDIFGYGPEQGQYVCIAKHKEWTAVADPLIVHVQRIQETFLRKPTKGGINLAYLTWTRLECGYADYNFEKEVVMWFERLEYGREKTVDLDSWRKTDDKGVLYILNNEAAKPGKYYYRCGLRNDITMLIEYGDLWNVTLLPKIGITMPIMDRILYTSNPKQEVELGSNFSLYCIIFSRYDVQVYWTATEGQLHGDHAWTYQNSSQLTVEEANWSHAGNYTCMYTYNFALGMRRRVKILFEVEIKAAPEFSQTPPSVIELFDGESVILHCSPDEYSSGQVGWLENGIQMERKFAVGNQSLTIKFLPHGYSGMIQCNISNSHGWRISNTYVSVIRTPPSLLQAGNIFKLVQTAQSVQLSCNVTGNSRPIKIWYFNDKPIHNNAIYTMTYQEGLTIKNVQRRNTGNYRCDAFNQYGIVRHTTSLYVFNDLGPIPFSNSSETSWNPLVVKFERNLREVRAEANTTIMIVCAMQPVTDVVLNLPGTPSVSEESTTIEQFHTTFIARGNGTYGCYKEDGKQIGDNLHLIVGAT